jgi:hypothetical protein
MQQKNRLWRFFVAFSYKEKGPQGSVVLQLENRITDSEPLRVC